LTESTDLRPRDLPDFEQPPLDEVALSVQFEPLPGLQVPQIGLLWSVFRKDFPRTEQHPPLEPVIERFGPPAGIGIRFELSNTPPQPRCWFLKQDGTELIQVQQDRFIQNWRRRETNDPYPRYEYVRDQFSQNMRAFCVFLEQEKIGAFVPVQCEITYTNVIEPGDAWERHGQLGNVITPLVLKYSDRTLSEPESMQFAAQYQLPGNEGPMGRLYVLAQPVFRGGDNRALILLNLTVRGVPAGNRILEDVLNFMNFGREQIVRAFASITTPEMHKLWRRKDVG
jgi:uncharacterized protein (TIGR04255 family)